MATNAPDRIDAAMAAADEQPTIPLVELALQLRSGRAIALRVPADMQPQEALELIAAVSRDLPGLLLEAALARGAVRTIETPRGPHLVKPI